MSSDRLKHIATSAYRIASSLERGAIIHPLAKTFQKLQESPDAIRLLLVGHSRDASIQALKVILDNIVPPDECEKLSPTGARVLEIRLGEGFALLAPKEEKYQDPIPLVQAVDDFLQDTKRFKEIVTGQLRISVSIETLSTPPVNLMIAPPLEDINEAPIMISSLADNADWMMFVTPSGQLNTFDKGTLSALSLHCLCSYPVQMKEELPNSFEKVFSSPIISSPLNIKAVKKEIDKVESMSETLRFILGDWRNIKDLEDALIVLESDLHDRKTKLENQRLLQDQGLDQSSGTSTNQDLREFQDRNRTWLQDRFDEIFNALERRHALELQPGGPAYSEIKGLAEELEISNLTQIESGDRIVLNLSSEKQDMFGYALRSHISRIISEDIYELETDIKAACNHITELLQREIKTPPKLAFPAPEQRDVENRITELANPEIRYSSEMMKMTLNRRFSQARGWLIPVMMGAMIIGALATMFGENSSEIRSMFYIGSIPILLAGIIWTYISQKPKEDAHKTRELRRVREEVLRDIRRMTTDLLRKEEQIIKKKLDKILRDAISKLGRAIRKEEQYRQQKSSQSKLSHANNTRTIEQNLRDLDQNIQEIGRLQTQAMDVKEKIIQAFKRDLSKS